MTTPHAPELPTDPTDRTVTGTDTDTDRGPNSGPHEDSNFGPGADDDPGLDPAEPEPEVEPESAGRRFWSMVLVVGLAVLLGAGVGFFAWKRLHPAPTPIAVKGVVLLSADNRVESQANGACAGGEGYTDIRAGAAVTVTDPAGATVGAGQLQPGALQESPICVFPFTLSVPSGKNTYRFGLRDRGTVTVPETSLGGPDGVVILVLRSGITLLPND